MMSLGDFIQIPIFQATAKKKKSTFLSVYECISKPISYSYRKNYVASLTTNGVIEQMVYIQMEQMAYISIEQMAYRWSKWSIEQMI